MCSQLKSHHHELNNMTQLTCFKAYDIRGKLGTELNEEIAYNIGLPMDRSISLKPS